mmetsp:Transcript_36711/g.110193  ORF Transcript_36711/g.110193 Transcript_36711/m.110193 type:complete len:205 (-) Transcript_36711:307-921(-)|eukprot:CAMPEP_0113550660 /NCGR_PEP_ID=MMETSP0015_2-20120614/14104_1 /TAXON_ID=2838 /ORGANISM="Odontella" /LENGTH=204 /DNA_ID=CAMNT_0000451489 /DNA_START=159 /DNA_END=773 /DNA_ORIENTATION=+ /assembly_acc=CAM_ASM_000160
MAHRMAVSAAARAAAMTPCARMHTSLAGRLGVSIPVDALNRRRRQDRRVIHSTTLLLADADSKRVPKAAVDHAKVEAVFERILNLDLVELHLVTMLLAEKLGVSADGAPAGGGGLSAGGGGSAAAEEAAPAEEKTKFDLKLVGFDTKAKIKVIKEVRKMTGLGLKDAKEMVEGAPKVLLKDMKKEEVEELKAKLEAVGAEVELV